jgi:hypothetical protein
MAVTQLKIDNYDNKGLMVEVWNRFDNHIRVKQKEHEQARIFYILKTSRIYVFFSIKGLMDRLSGQLDFSNHKEITFEDYFKLTSRKDTDECYNPFR